VQQQAEHDRRMSLGKESKSDAVRQLGANPIPDPDPSPSPSPNPSPSPSPNPSPNPSPSPNSKPNPNPNPNHTQIRRLGGDVSSLSKQMGEMHGSVTGLASALAAIQQHLEGGGRGGGGRSLPCQRPPGEAASSGAADAAGAGASVGAACAAMAAGAGSRPPPARSSAGGCAFCSAVSGAAGGSVGGASMTTEARLERLEATVTKLSESLQSLLGQSPPGRRSRLQRLMTPPPLRPPTGSASANPPSPLEA
jgi:hypothetical protein